METKAKTQTSDYMAKEIKNKTLAMKNKETE